MMPIPTAYAVNIERGLGWPGPPDSAEYVQCEHCHKTNRIEQIKENGFIAEHLLEEND